MSLSFISISSSSVPSRGSLLLASSIDSCNKIQIRHAFMFVPCSGVVFFVRMSAMSISSIEKPLFFACRLKILPSSAIE